MKSNLETHPIKDGVLQALQGEGGVFTETADAVSRAIREACFPRTLAGATAAGSIDLVVKSAVGGIVGAEDDAAIVAKGILVGVVRGCREKGPSAVGVLSRASGIVIREVFRRGLPPAPVARGLVQGAQICAKDLGLDVKASIWATGAAALDMARDLDPSAALEVRAALMGAIEAIHVGLEKSDGAQTHS
jgi:hypothetical protein